MQLKLFDEPKKLRPLQNKVIKELQKGGWKTAREIGEAVGASPASVAARIRELRQPAWGAWAIPCRLVRTIDGDYAPAYKIKA